MKKLFKISTLLLLIPALFLTSCKDDDEGNSYVTLPPTNLQSHTGYEKVTLSWTAPNSNFLKEYLVTWTPEDNGGSATVESGITTATISGLTNEQQYTFTVVAVYENGEKSSALIKRITPSASLIEYDMPDYITVTPSFQAAYVNWLPLDKVDGANLVKFIVEATAGEETVTTEVNDPEATSATIEGLTNGKTYTIHVIAVYDTEVSVTSEENVTVTPSDLITSITANNVANVQFDAENIAYTLNYVEEEDFSQVEVAFTMADGVSYNGKEGSGRVTLDLTSPKTIVLVMNEMEYTVTISAAVDPNAFIEGYFKIDTYNDLEYTSSGYIGPQGEFTVTTTGSAPSFKTNVLAQATTSPVLHFNYKSNKAIDLMLAVNGKATQYKIASLSATTQETDYSFDLGMLMSNNSWSEFTSLELFLGDQSGAEITFSDFTLRGRNDDETKLSESMFLVFSGSSGATLKDVTEMYSYTDGLTYLYIADNGAADPQINTKRTDDLSGYNKLIIKYKCPKNFELTLYYNIVGGQEYNYKFNASNDWIEAEFDINAAKDKVTAAGGSLSAGGSMRFDFDGIADGTTELYIRDVRFVK